MTTLLICADGWNGPPPDLDGVDSVLVDELCVGSRSVEAAIPEATDELAVAVHRRQVNLGALQAGMRRAGFDPFAVAVVDLDAVGTASEFPVAVAAGLARARAFRGAAPEQIKLLPSDRRTRRGFLSLGAPTYTGAPRIVPEVCAADRGCDLCVTECPAGALSWSDGRVVYDPTSCVVCGICLTTCPVGAVDHPTASPAAISSEIAAAVAASETTTAIRFRCREAVVPAEPGWYQVEVPCTQMLTVGWFLAARALGAADVDAAPCSRGGCTLGGDERLAGTLADLATVVNAVGSPVADVQADDGFAAAATTRLIERFADPAAPGWVELSVSDVGSVTIDPDACTACEACATVCPPSALLSTSDDGVRITFDPRMCVACGLCVRVCPEVDEGAIALRRGFDLADRRRGRRTLRHDPTPRCELCGAPVAPASMLARISELLGPEGSATMALVGRRCIDCRGR